MEPNTRQLLNEINENFGKIPFDKSASMQELLNLAQALALAVDRGFMKREHAGAVWKRILTISGVDTTKKEVSEDAIA